MDTKVDVALAQAVILSHDGGERRVGADPRVCPQGLKGAHAGAQGRTRWCSRAHTLVLKGAHAGAPLPASWYQPVILITGGR